MIVYLTVCVLTLMWGKYAEHTPSKIKTKNGSTIIRPSAFFAGLLFLSWAAVYSLRYRVGTDFGAYYRSYLQITNNNESLADFLDKQRDMLFGYIEYFCAKLSRGNWIFFAFVCAALTYLPVVAAIRRKSVDFTASALLFLFTMQFFAGFNGIRQAIAVSLSFFAYYCCLKERKYIWYAVVIALAFGFHSTALIVIPVHLLSLKNLRAPIIKITIAVLLFSFVFLGSLWKYVISFLEKIGQSKLASDYETLSESGSSVLRLTVAMLPPLLGIFFQEQLRREYADTDSEIILLLIAAVFSLFSLNTWLFSRIAQYFNMSLIMFLPKLTCLFKEKSRPLAEVIMLALYFGYMCAMLLHGDGQVLPYTFIDF